MPDRRACRPPRRSATPGFSVTIFEAHPYAGGMVGGAIPAYRLPQLKIDQDMAILEELGVEIRYNQTAGVDFTLDDLRADGFRIDLRGGRCPARQAPQSGWRGLGGHHGCLALPAQRAGGQSGPHRRPGGCHRGRRHRHGCGSLGTRVGASECLSHLPANHRPDAGRSAKRSTPARRKGSGSSNWPSPHALHIEDGKLAGLVCTKTEYRGDRDSSGRKIPHDVADSEFEVPLDTLILAISQHSVLDFFGDEVPDSHQPRATSMLTRSPSSRRSPASTPAGTWLPMARLRL